MNIRFPQMAVGMADMVDLDPIIELLIVWADE